MNRYSHMAIGAAAGMAAAALTGHPNTAAVGALVGGVVGTWPDIDTRWGLPARGQFQRACRPMQSPLEHRGMLHAPVVGIALGALVMWATMQLDHVLPWALLLGVPGGAWLGTHLYPAWNLLGLFVMTGYWSHLVADSLSPMGVPWLWPLSRNRYRPTPLTIRSGARVIEYPLALGVLAGVLLWGWPW